MHEVAPERWDSPLRANCALMSSVRTEYYERKGVGRRERVRMMNDNDAHTQLLEEDVTVCACVRAHVRVCMYVSLCECHCHWPVFSSLFIVFLQLSASGRMPHPPHHRACVSACVCARARARAKDTRQTDRSVNYTSVWGPTQLCKRQQHPQNELRLCQWMITWIYATAAGSIKEGPSPPHVLYY